MPDTALAEADYEAIETALRETERGRWFLAEHARRNRTSETRLLLRAIERLEQVVRERRGLEIAGAARDAEPAAAALAESRRKDSPPKRPETRKTKEPGAASTESGTALDFKPAAACDADFNATGAEVQPTAEARDGEAELGAASAAPKDIDREATEPSAESPIDGSERDGTSPAPEGTDGEAAETEVRPSAAAGAARPTPKTRLDAMTPEQVLALFG